MGLCGFGLIEAETPLFREAEERDETANVSYYSIPHRLRRPTRPPEGGGLCFLIGKRQSQDPHPTPFYTREVFFLVGVLGFRGLVYACCRF